ncbi:MAG: hypothetical protein COA99_01340 [Moraxellaceae bacterium]|nr:MAG: hypothetical protein COA99_01340 [Moraxellaceae bacterium]
MKIDLTLIPTTLDVAHIGLVVAILVLLLVLLVVSRSKRSAATADSAVVDAEVSVEAIKQESPEPANLLKETTPEAALQLLMLLQQDARLIDFIHEDLTGFSDSDVGAAARVVHEGSKKVLQQVFTFQPIRTEEEETTITLPEGFNATENRLTGNVSGSAPFTGVLVHKGWRVTNISLPQLAKEHDVYVVAPAEVEL